MQVTSQAARLNVLALSIGLNAAGPAGAFNGISAVPYSAGPTPTDLSIYADFTVATFAGSAAIAVVYSGPQEAPNRQPYENTQLFNWICSAAPALPETLLGVLYFLPGAPNVLVGVDVFPVPVTIQKQYDNLTWIGTVP